MLPPPGIVRPVARPRIYGGSARGRPLATPRSGTRPTPGRVREALFDILAFEPRGLFLDLYAGSGALGLEAASRGWRAICVDLGREAVEVIGRNARDLGLEVEVRRADALAAPAPCAARSTSAARRRPTPTTSPPSSRGSSTAAASDPAGATSSSIRPGSRSG
jgi:16S rRNA (guanine(966)-N(2))-methyltransferase RsmD